VARVFTGARCCAESPAGCWRSGGSASSSTASTGATGPVFFRPARNYPPPPELAFEHIPLLNGSGYDGQFYHYIAHNPFLEKYAAAQFDRRAYRYGKILVPLLAYAVALGRERFIDVAYVAVILAFVGPGAACLSEFALARGYPAATGCAFLIVPATIVGIETLTVDVALVALLAAFTVALERKSRPALLAAAPLARETGAVLLAACALSAILRRAWRDCAAVLLAALPWIGWLAFVRWKAGPNLYQWRMVPFAGTADAISTAVQGMRAGQSLGGFDLWQVGGILLAAALAFWRVRRGGTLHIACVLFAAIVVVHQGADLRVNHHALGRFFSPLAVCLGMQGLAERDFRLLLPLGLMVPRFLLGPAARVLLAFH
jgi:hypothetical protein